MADLRAHLCVCVPVRERELACQGSQSSPIKVVIMGPFVKVLACIRFTLISASLVMSRTVKSHFSFGSNKTKLTVHWVCGVLC